MEPGSGNSYYLDGSAQRLGLMEHKEEGLQDWTSGCGKQLAVPGGGAAVLGL